LAPLRADETTTARPDDGAALGQRGLKRAAKTHVFCGFLCNSQAVQKIEKVSKNKEFFFEKKNQKTFAPLREVVPRPLAKNY
jgi:hypothetical protein